LNKPAGRKSAVFRAAGAKAQGKRKFFAGFFQKRSAFFPAPPFTSPSLAPPLPVLQKVLAIACATIGCA
jgi:hypothetical protein